MADETLEDKVREMRRLGVLEWDGIRLAPAAPEPVPDAPALTPEEQSMAEQTARREQIAKVKSIMYAAAKGRR